jgi:hypothetical protein
LIHNATILSLSEALAKLIAEGFGSSERMGFNRRPLKGNPKARRMRIFPDEKRGWSE